MPKFAPPPPVAPETCRALLAAAAAFAAIEPWEFACDRDVVGLIDPVTGEMRIGCVLGNAREIFAAVFYRRPAGLRWILGMRTDAPNPEDLNSADGMDCLKLELVPKLELMKEDLAMLKAAAFKPHARRSRRTQPGGSPAQGRQAAGENPHRRFASPARPATALRRPANSALACVLAARAGRSRRVPQPTACGWCEWRTGPGLP